MHAASMALFDHEISTIYLHGEESHGYENQKQRRSVLLKEFQAESAEMCIELNTGPRICTQSMDELRCTYTTVDIEITPFSSIT